MNAHTPKPNTDTAIAFLKALDLDGLHHLTALDPSGRGGIVSRLFQPHAWEEIAAWIAAHWHWNIYYSVNEPIPGAPHRKLRKEDIARIRAVVADLDPRGDNAAETSADRQRILAEAEGLSIGPCPPTFAVDSGNGAQFVYKLAEKLDAKIYLPTAEAAANGIGTSLGGDDVYNGDRIMRLAGTMNWSSPGKIARGLLGGRVQVLTSSAIEKTYTLEEIAQTYAPVPVQREESDAAIAGAIAELDFEAAQAATPEQGAALLKRLLATHPAGSYGRRLLAGDASAAPKDTSGSGWRGALARLLASSGFTAAEYAVFALHWEPGQPSSGADLTERDLARDWARIAASHVEKFEAGMSLLGPIEDEEPDTSDFPDLEAKAEEPVELEWINPADWHGYEPPERVWYVPGLLPHNEVTMLTGMGGIGKSLLALMLLICIAMGLPFFGRATTRARVVGFFCEDDVDELHRRTRAICAYLDVDLRELGEWMRLAPRKYADNLLATFPRGDGAVLKRAPAFDALLAFAKSFQAQVALLDTIADVFGGNEIDRQQVRQFVQSCAGRLAHELGACLIVGHPSKSGQAEGGDGTSGSTAWRGSVRSHLYMEPAGEKGSGFVRLSLMKSNYGPSGESWELRFNRGVLEVVSASRPAEGVPETTSLIHSVVLGAIAKAHAANVRLALAANSKHRIEKVLRRREPDALKPYSAKQIDEAVKQLLALGVIAEENAGWDASHNPIKTVVVRARPDELSDEVLPDEPHEGGLFD